MIDENLDLQSQLSTAKVEADNAAAVIAEQAAEIAAMKEREDRVRGICSEVLDQQREGTPVSQGSQIKRALCREILQQLEAE